MTEQDFNTEYWRRWGVEIEQSLQDMDEFGRTKCRKCGRYKITDDTAVCLDCSILLNRQKS